MAFLKRASRCTACNSVKHNNVSCNILQYLSISCNSLLQYLAISFNILQYRNWLVVWTTLKNISQLGILLLTYGKIFKTTRKCLQVSSVDLPETIEMTQETQASRTGAGLTTPGINGCIGPGAGLLPCFSELLEDGNSKTSDVQILANVWEKHVFRHALYFFKILCKIFGTCSGSKSQRTVRLSGVKLTSWC